MNALRNACAAAVFMGLALTAPVAWADENGAETLFQEGLAAMKRSDFNVACEAFTKSNRSDPSPGTQINLAICFEKQKKWASAWTWYRSAAGLAQQRNQEAREKSANESATRIKPQLHYVVVVVKDAPTDTVVKRDGAEVTVSLGGKPVPLPIDPGDHQIDVTATGKKAWTKAITVADTPATDQIDVTLENAPVEAATASPLSTPAATMGMVAPVSEVGNGQRTVGIIVGGAGVLTGLAAVGVYILAANEAGARDDKQKELNRAPGDVNLMKSVNSHNDAAGNDQLISIVLASGAAVMLGVGAVLYFTAPKAQKHVMMRITPLPLLGPSLAGMGLGGTF